MKTRSHDESYNNNPRHHAEDERACEWPDCLVTGEFRAPRSRKEINSYRWFCLEHIRQYNKSWNYYEGMDDAQVEADRRRDTVWQRPSWKLGINAAGLDPDHVIDPFDVMGARTATGNSGTTNVRPPISKEEENAYKLLDIDCPISTEGLKARYKELVKIHHPDANNGSKASEEKIKKINQAYHTLRDALKSSG